MTQLSRREVLRGAGAAALLAALPLRLAAPAGAAPRRAALSEHERRTLAAVADRLIPADAHGPSAAEAGAVRYIERALRGDLADRRGAYTAALAALDAFARARHGQRFAALPAPRRDALLAALEAGTAPGFAPDSAAVFNMLRTHVVEGMFGDPIHGGNRGFAGWDLIGYPGVRPVVPERDGRLDVRVRRVHRSLADHPTFRVARRRG
jgi:hypothetical protein